MDTDSGASADYKIAEKNNPRLMIELLIVNMPKGKKNKTTLLQRHFCHNLLRTSAVLKPNRLQDGEYVLSPLIN